MTWLFDLEILFYMTGWAVVLFLSLKRLFPPTNNTSKGKDSFVKEYNDSSQNTELEDDREEKERIKKIASNFEKLKGSKSEIVKTKDYNIMEGEVPIVHNGELHKPKVVILSPGSASPEETMELMDFARKRFQNGKVKK